MRPDEQDRATLLANAHHFRAVAFRGRGVYDSVDASSLEQARARAGDLYLDRPVGIYVVALDGTTERSHHLENWLPPKKRGRYKRIHT